MGHSYPFVFTVYLSDRNVFCRLDNNGILRVSGQQQVDGASSPPARLLNLPADESFVLYLGKCMIIWTLT